ncbi:unnamed protein product [Caenorhabditis bovis]|uniref:Tyrosine specific protein phosphatases domain-containing protein n=1 Tax=Caenorhabditis bovis TaxID=2654633 RepID=A0A8S1ENJ9_9PELO|nr:unnamed protein product [Caenorhabditis bovis]
MVRVRRVVPKDWARYSPIGNVIPRTRFIVFKTPLNDKLACQLPKEKRFNVNDLFMQLNMRGQRLGLVVDLTDTDRYYDKNDIIGLGVQYEKINCPGRGFIERDECIESFHQAIQNYSDNCDDQDALIGVHCTHGINRSGYLICRFLIERLGWSSHEALDAFEHARGYPIEKGAYVMALHKAAKDVRNRRVESDSDSEGRRKKSRKNKRKHREEENGHINIINAFLGELGQQVASVSGAFENSPISNGYGTPDDQNPQPQQPHWGYAVKKSKYQSLNQPNNNGTPVESSPFVEDEEQYDDGEDDGQDVQDGEVQVAADGSAPSASSKRRARRHRMQKMLAVMKRGNFHEIQAMQEEVATNHGAAATL